MMEGIRNDQIDVAMWTIGTLSPVIADKSGVRWVNLAAGEIPEISAMPYVVTMGLNSWIAGFMPDAVVAVLGAAYTGRLIRNGVGKAA